MVSFYNIIRQCLGNTMVCKVALFPNVREIEQNHALIEGLFQFTHDLNALCWNVSVKNQEHNFKSSNQHFIDYKWKLSIGNGGSKLFATDGGSLSRISKSNFKN